VTNRSAICHFLLVSHWNRISIFNRFRDICIQIHLGHDFDLSRSRDVIGHVSNRSATCRFLLVSHCNRTSISNRFRDIGPQNQCARTHTHTHTPQVILYSVPCNVLHWTDNNSYVYGYWLGNNDHFDSKPQNGTCPESSHLRQLILLICSFTLYICSPCSNCGYSSSFMSMPLHQPHLWAVKALCLPLALFLSSVAVMAGQA